jgi:2-polyprenyl-3-methyl-5-hydroxy-6-metoxy-1,4-benzoquinol methylase
MANDVCPACGSDRSETLTTAVGERAYCTACFHGWRTRFPSFAYAETAMCGLGTSPQRLEGQIAFFRPFVTTGARILEIGCATGELARATRSALNPAGYEAIELSPMGEHARGHVDHLHRRPLRSLLDDGDIAGRFDIILMSHVLEHIADPGGELDAMKEVMAPKGSIFLEVPNQSGSRKLPFDDNRSHLHFFSATSLAAMLSRRGLDIAATATDARLDARYSDSLQIIARPFQIPSPSTRLLIDDRRLADPAGIVVWGAGSLAEEVLANFFEPSRIDFFVDRDPGKQGSERLGRPVRGPGALGSEPRTILINSIDFADAIAADIAAIAPGVAHHLVRIGDLIDA